MNDYSEDLKMQIESRSEKIFSELTQKSTKCSSYFAVYDRELSRYAGKKDLVVVEVGIENGGSLYLWRSFFGEEARIIGVDLSPTAAAMRDHGFEIHIGDQASPDFWREFFAKVGPVDILIDDGGHTNKHQILTVECCLDHIKDDGLILVEDVITSYLRQYGNPSRYSFISYCKFIIDKIQARNLVYSSFDLNRFALAVYSISFYESIVCLHVDRRICDRSKLAFGGHQEIGAINYWNADKRLVGFDLGRKGKAMLAYAPAAIGRFAISCYHKTDAVLTQLRFVLENLGLRGFFK